LAEGVGPLKHFRVLPTRSSVAIKARSNVGPITFVTGSVSGDFGLLVSGGDLLLSHNMTSRLEVPLGTLASGNVLYDAEIMRRVDARRFPIATVELAASSRIKNTNSYALTGSVNLHGVTQGIEGVVTAELSTPETIVVNGKQAIDIREFELGVPSTFMLKIYPDVEIEMHLEAEA
jgi:hypothetical protein